MNLPLHIAKRYLFSKKSHNAINIISMVSVFGIAVATMAMVCTLSVFNGFTDIVSKTFSEFDPQLEITVAQGKVFDPTDSLVQKAMDVEGVALVSETLEENALLRFEGRQEPILLKGVSSEFVDMADISKLIIDGEFALRLGDIDYAVLGAGVASRMAIRANSLSPLELYMPKRNERVNLANPSTAFTRTNAYMAGVFALNQAKYDDQIMMVSIDLARELLQYEKEVTTLNVKVKDGVSVESVQSKIRSVLGDGYHVKNRFEQQEDTFKMVNIEKWVTFLMLAIIQIIAVFNVIGSLSMLILEKGEDVKILQNMGASNKLISKIFLFEGWLITSVGAIGGLVLGLVICLIQQHFGLLKLGSTPGEFIIDAYPVSVQFSDIVVIFITVTVIGFLAVLYPVNSLRKRL